MRRIDHGTAGRAAKAARKRRHSPAPSHADRLATEAMAPRSVFVPPALIKKPGRQYEAPEKPPGRRYQPVGPPSKPKKGAKKTYTPYQRALGRPLGIDIEHQTPTQIAGVTEHGLSRAQRRRILRQQAQAAVQARAHGGAAQPLRPRADWHPRESDFGGDLSGVARGVGSYVERTARDRYGEIIHPDPGKELHRARQGVEFTTGIDPGDPLKHGPYWLAANAALLALPGAGRALGMTGRLTGRALDRALVANMGRRLAEEAGAGGGLVGGVSRTARRVASEERGAVGLGKEPPVPPGHVRLYRGEGMAKPGVHGTSERGLFFSSKRSLAEIYARKNKGDLFYLDVPAEEAKRYAQWTPGADKPSSSHVLPRELADKKQLLSKEPTKDLLKQLGRRLGEERGSVRFGYGKEPPVPEEPLTPAEQVIEAMPQAKRQRRLTEKGYSEEWRKRVAAGAGELEAGGGTEEAFQNAMKELEGELPKRRFDKLRNLTQEDVDDLMGQIANHPDLRFFEKIRTYTALRDVLSARVPTRSQIKLMERVFGPADMELLKDAHSLSTKLRMSLGELWNLPRSLAASFDLSAPFRQGLVIGAGHPVLFFKNFEKMFKAAGSQEFYDALQLEIQERRNFGLYKKAGLDLTDLESGLAHREERYFGAQAAERIPIAGRFVMGSGRAYTAYLNRMRADVFDQIIKVAESKGKDVEDPDFLRQLGRLLNAASGRGHLPGKLENAAPLLNGIFFSPKLGASRIEMLLKTGRALTPRAVSKMDPTVRKETLKMMGGLTAVMGGILGLVEASGMGTVNWLNPTSADWLKVKIGDTRVDLTGGFLPWIRVEEQLRQGRITSSTTGREMALEGGVGKMSPGDIALRFTRSKMAPQTGAIWDIAFRRHFPVGSPITTRGQQALTLVQAGKPLGIGDVVDYWRQVHSPWGTAATAAMTTFGVGAQTYPDKKPGEDAVKQAQDDMTKFGLGKLGPKTTAEVKAKAAYHDDIIHATSYVDKMKIQTAEYARQHGGVNMDPVNRILAIKDSKLREAAAKRQYHQNIPYVTFPRVEVLNERVHEAEDKQLDAKLKATTNGSHR